jgi:uncharacterized protein YktA (UPF0223 family)
MNPNNFALKYYDSMIDKWLHIEDFISFKEAFEAMEEETEIDIAYGEECRYCIIQTSIVYLDPL